MRGFGMIQVAIVSKGDLIDAHQLVKNTEGVHQVSSVAITEVQGYEASVEEMLRCVDMPKYRDFVATRLLQRKSNLAAQSGAQETMIAERDEEEPNTEAVPVSVKASVDHFRPPAPQELTALTKPASRGAAMELRSAYQWLPQVTRRARFTAPQPSELRAKSPRKQEDIDNLRVPRAPGRLLSPGSQYRPRSQRHLLMRLPTPPSLAPNDFKGHVSVIQKPLRPHTHHLGSNISRLGIPETEIPSSKQCTRIATARLHQTASQLIRPITHRQTRSGIVRSRVRTGGALSAAPNTYR